MSELNQKGGNVVIVGKPNVGKSTLFNRIVRKRIAITMKESGTTRDRIKVATEWLGRKFFLTDTGGFMSDETLEITRKVNQQIRNAINNADVVIFLVDGSALPTIQDFTIVEMLRKENKPFILAVNKIDAKITRDNIPEFYRFGAKEMVEISAEHGRGVDELLDKVIEKLPQHDMPDTVQPASSVLCLLIIGRPNVGKSMFLNCILNQERAIVSEVPGTTRDAIEEEFTLEDRKFRIIDTAGLRKKSRVKQSVEYFSIQRVIRHIPQADVVILLLDSATDTYPPVPLTQQDKTIIDLVLARGKSIVIGLNKIDLIPSIDRKALINNTKFELKNFDFIPIVLTSALKNKGIEETIRKAVDVYEQGGKRVSEELIEETILPKLQDNLPSHRARYVYLKQTGVRPPKFNLITNVPTDVKDSYKRFVLNELRNYFGFAGNQIHLKVVRK